MSCKICMEKNVDATHPVSEKHLKNLALQEYSLNKTKLTGNRKGVLVSCNVKTSLATLENYTNGKIKISAKPNEEVVFSFTIQNDSRKEQVQVESAEIFHTKYNFNVSNHGLNGTNTLSLLPKAKLQQNITVTFKSQHIGQYETPISFLFRRLSTNEQITIIRNMVVFVEQNQTEHEKITSPYACKEVVAKTLFKSHGIDHNRGLFHIPKNNKSIYLRSMKVTNDSDEQMKILASDIRLVFEKGVSKDNYEKFFHNLLWFEETMVRLNIKKYNMSGVTLEFYKGGNNYGLAQRGRYQGVPQEPVYGLFVPGLAEKRPSLMLGDWMFVRPHKNVEVMFEAVVIEINDNIAIISKIHPNFQQYYSVDAKFDIRFFMSRIPLERMHVAVHNVTTLALWPRIFPVETKKIGYKAPQFEWYNPLVEENPEQRVAVEHIVSGTSGTSPYLLHGPPGTGKTITIVEAILQLVTKNPQNRILVCTDSNMAADHVATMLIKFSHMFSQDRLLLRASSKFRVWETLPDCLAKYSNGTRRDNFVSVSLDDFKSYNIVITTLSHAAKFGRQLVGMKCDRHITHLFIDEAAQASEPACLIPLGGLLAPNGHLVLAGDPHQLGPVVISHSASTIGLGTSLMERLMNMFPMYSHEKNNPNYVVMLRNNFRSNKEILDIPDKLFYKGQLRALAAMDSLSDVDILGERTHSQATVFHGILSKEQKVGKSPSYFNSQESDIVKQYVQALVTKHKVLLEDIGIVTPYIRQVYHIKKMLRELRYEKIEVGTVEAFQGKEKRVIIISTVRANCNLLDYDAKFQLGFLVDDKRFNVAITRAKAKVIIIGNPLCLEKDIKWRTYMQKCRDLGTYLGFDSAEVQHDASGRELLNIIKPMLAEMKITNNNDTKK